MPLRRKRPRPFTAADRARARRRRHEIITAQRAMNMDRIVDERIKGYEEVLRRKSEEFFHRLSEETDPST